MRRKDREITDFHEQLDIIKRCETLTLGLNDEGYPYLVPLNFGLDVEDDTVYLYFHSAMQGRKMELIQQDPHATFSMDCGHNFIMYEESMSCTMGYESVIGRGIIEFVEDDKKYEALKIIMRQYHEEDFKFNTNMMKVTAVYRLKVEEMSGKRRNNIH